ncbi:thioredoxin family protein [Enterococcus sp. BWM-S5]|uniref:Thioredoxin family protein n=1 Tax=Enterococcus larvae TaxID=2794352 RepID=A0ABS4CMR1_9ENTE|nr:thioredoxin family protein [Enterococcus larvae]MBP1047242.1 thioredoxin family protein [Enterococcus larvae]
MNKKRVIEVFGVVLLLILFIYSWQVTQNEKKLQSQLIDERTNYPNIYNIIDSITITNFEKRVGAGEELIFYIGRPTCGDCTEFEPKLIAMIEEEDVQDKILYLNVAQLRESEEKWNEFIEDYDVKYTPTLVKFSKGKIVKKVNWTPEGGTDLAQFSDFLKSCV